MMQSSKHPVYAVRLAVQYVCLYSNIYLFIYAVYVCHVVYNVLQKLQNMVILIAHPWHIK